MFLSDRPRAISCPSVDFESFNRAVQAQHIKFHYLELCLTIQNYSHILDLCQALESGAPGVGWIVVARNGNSGTLGKALDVLEAVASREAPPRFTDLLDRIDQPRGTLHRNISNLIEEDLLAVRSDHSYELGPKLLKLAARAWSGNQFRSIAEPHLKALGETTGETIHLGLLNDIEVIYLDKVEGRQSVRMHSQIGNASPVYCTGVGKAALSALSDEELEARIARITFKTFTGSTLSTPQALRSEISEIRKSGIAYDREEHEPGIHCIAAPVFSGSRDFFAGISVTAPVFRVSTDQLADWKPLIQQTAAVIMEDMANKLGPRA